MKTFSGGISIPMSPRATMMPSDAAMISSIFLTIRTKSPDQKKEAEKARKEAEKNQKQQGNKPAAQPAK